MKIKLYLWGLAAMIIFVVAIGAVLSWAERSEVSLCFEPPPVFASLNGESLTFVNYVNKDEPYSCTSIFIQRNPPSRLQYQALDGVVRTFEIWDNGGLNDSAHLSIEREQLDKSGGFSITQIQGTKLRVVTY